MGISNKHRGTKTYKITATTSPLRKVSFFLILLSPRLTAGRCRSSCRYLYHPFGDMYRRPYRRAAAGSSTQAAAISIQHVHRSHESCSLCGRTMCVDSLWRAEGRRTLLSLSWATRDRTCVWEHGAVDARLRCDVVQQPSSRWWPPTISASNSKQAGTRNYMV